MALLNTLKRLVFFLAAVQLALADENVSEVEQEPMQEPSRGTSAKQLEEYEPDIVEVAGLKEEYGLEFDRNHMLGPITTKFVFD